MTTLGRATSLRVAYAAACQDVAMPREENAKLAERLAWSEANALKWEQNTRESAKVCVDVTKRMTAERDAATARADAAEAEVVRLQTFIARKGTLQSLTGECFCLNCNGEWIGVDQKHVKDRIVLAAIKAFNAAQKEASHD